MSSSAEALPVTPLETHAIRARRRPGGVAMYWALRLLAAWLLAAPIASVLGGTGVSRFPDGDARLFAPGGAYLMEALRRGVGPLTECLQNTAWFALILGYLSLLPLAGLLYALCHGGRLRPGDVAREALRSLAPFTLLAGLTLLVQAGVAVVGLILLSVLHRSVQHASIYQSLDVRDAELYVIGAAALVLAVVLVIGVVQDLARAALIRHGQGVGHALGQALRTARRRPFGTLLAWFVPATWSIAAVALGALLVGHLHVERAGIGRVLAVLAVHQLVALALVGLKAQWLAGALRLVGGARHEETPSGGGGRSESLPEDLQVAPGGAIPAEVEPHHPAPELAP